MRGDFRMTHALGRVVADGRTFTHSSGLDLTPGAGSLGAPRFVFLHFDSVVLNGGARLEVAGLRHRCVHFRFR